MSGTRQRSISMREGVFAIGVVVFFGVMGARLFDVQIVRAEYFKALAQANRLFQERIPGERGALLDRYGDPIAFNKKVYYRLDSPDQVWSSQTRVSDKEALQVAATGAATLSYELERYYPFGESLSQVTGYTGLVTAEELVSDKSLHPRDRVGKLGLERVYEQFLRGKPGSAVYEINALGKRQRLLKKVESEPGISLSTTIDPYLSEVAYRLLAGKKGSVVVLDAKTGEVLTALSAPSFNATDLSISMTDTAEEAQRVSRVRSFFSNPQQLFFNRAVSGAYPPGSVFKIVTMAAGLEKGVLDTQTTVLDEGVLRVGEFSYANWYFTQYGGREGEIAVVRALARSNDIFFYKAAEWIGPFDLADFARQFGYGVKTGIELTAEVAGTVPDPDWKQKVLGEPWYLGNTYHFGIGQGDVLVTPLQVAQMTQAIANRGALCAPHLIPTTAAFQPTETGSVCTEIGVKEEHLNTVLEGMFDACSTGGTAYPFFPLNEQVRDPSMEPYQQLEQGAVACKTGTAEFGGEDTQGFRKTHGWFTMITTINPALMQLPQTQAEDSVSGRETLADVDSASDSAHTISESASEAALHDKWLPEFEAQNFPRRVVITVLVESDESTPYREGSRDAAPIARALLQWIYTGSTTGIIEQAQQASYQGE